MHRDCAKSKFLSIDQFNFYEVLGITYNRTDYAHTYPEPKDKEAFVKEMLYDYTYDSKSHSALPEHWNYPDGYGVAPGIPEVE